MQFKYIDVILPLPLEGTFTYSLRDNHMISVGQRVVVEFGSRKLYTAIVCFLHNNLPEGYRVKEVIAVLEEDKLVNQIQLDFWQWISDYYMSRIGDVLNVALPSSLKLASESKIIINPDFDGDIQEFTQYELSLVNALTHNKDLTVSKISDLLDKKSVFPIINSLIRKGVVQVREDLHDKYKKKTVLFVDSTKNIDELNECLNGFNKRSLKQKEFLNQFIQYKIESPKKKWKVKELLKKSGFSRQVLNSLVKKDILQIEKNEVSRLISDFKNLKEINLLSTEQQEAFDEIKSSFLKKNVCLLHGVTSSGKTEIYIKLIKEQLEKGKQVLYLLPEIALTTQIINRLRVYFGNKVGVYHSKLNNAERVEAWHAVKEKDAKRFQYPIILGARSSLFLPFYNLGLIIIDEEHESSFKQYSPSPRYHARDSAIYLAKLHKSKVLMGSATPSLESYYNAKKGKYSLVDLSSRYGNIKLPEIHLINIKKEYLKKKMRSHFSLFLIDNMIQELESGKQIILFQNRRGYSPILECDLCSWNPTCTSCDVSLTYHKNNNSLKCHYCGYSIEKITSCGNCNHNDMLDKGFGTQQIEEELNQFFPDVTTQRMDYDTTRNKYSYQNIIERFENGSIDILIGTQMITKGLDFDNVSIVGILNADSMLKFPDFRSFERAYQMMSQVAGRSGRKGKRGKVIIQTYDDDNDIILQVKQHDYKMMYTQQLGERKVFKYPPYVRIIIINLQHKNHERLEKLSERFAVSIRKSFGSRVLGPESPSLGRIRNYYQKNILLKIENNSSIKNAKEILLKLITRFKKIKDFKSLKINIDVDPN